MQVSQKRARYVIVPYNYTPSAFFFIFEASSYLADYSYNDALCFVMGSKDVTRYSGDKAYL